MTVAMLRLTGLATAGAEQAARELLADMDGHPDLRRLLVLDESALLAEHAEAYELLVTGHRVEELICVAVGPRTGNGRGLQLPGNLGGTQGSGVLWVGDPRGIDCRVATGAVATGHPASQVSGLVHLEQLLSLDVLFDRVHAILSTEVPGKVASPGLRLAGADDEAAMFAAALAVSIHRLAEPGPGSGAPFTGLLPAAAGRATLADGGELSRCRADVLDSAAAAAGAAARLTGLGRLFRRDRAELHDHLAEAGAALTDLRNQVAQLLRDANAGGELTDSQLRQVLAAGIRLPAPAEAGSAPGAGPDADPRSPVYRTVADAIRGGDTLGLVTKRLIETERELKGHGSASYLPQVERECPAALLARLADVPASPPWRRAGEWRRELGLDQAVRAANALTDLARTVAVREWSGMGAALGEISRIRIAIDGALSALTRQAKQASPVGDPGSGAQHARLSRLADTLTPVLGDLVLSVLAAETTSPSPAGPDAFGHASQRTAGLLAEWTQQVQTQGMYAQPTFAKSAMRQVRYAAEDDVAEIREAILHDPGQMMWQLCAPADLGALDAAVRPHVVRFAPPLNRDVLAHALPPDTVWIPAGGQAGLLRLVPLRAGTAMSSWGRGLADVSPAAEPSP